MIRKLLCKLGFHYSSWNPDFYYCDYCGHDCDPNKKELK